MNAKALLFFMIWPKNASTHSKKLPLTMYEMLLNVFPNEMPFKLSPNGIGYPEITRRTSGIFVYFAGSNLGEYVQIT